MDSGIKNSTQDVTKKDPQSLYLEYGRIEIGLAGSPMLSGRAVRRVSLIVTRRHSYSISLNIVTSLSEITRMLLVVKETWDRASVSQS